MITTEDLLEEIVGEIRDEYDTDEKEALSKINDSTYRVDGSFKLDDLNDELGTSLNRKIMIQLVDLSLKDLTDFLKPVIKSLLVMSGCLSKRLLLTELNLLL